MKRYSLPELPYDYAALEPHYSARLLELHHDKHHAAYVAGANATLDKLAEAREKAISRRSISCRKISPFISPATCSTRSFGST